MPIASSPTKVFAQCWSPSCERSSFTKCLRWVGEVVVGSWSEALKVRVSRTVAVPSNTSDCGGENKGRHLALDCVSEGLTALNPRNSTSIKQHLRLKD